MSTTPSALPSVCGRPYRTVPPLGWGHHKFFTCT